MSIKSTFSKTAIATALLCASGASFAAMGPDYYMPSYQDHSGVYISGQIGYGRQVIDSDTETVTDPLLGTVTVRGEGDDEGGVAGRLAIGYDFNENFGIELGGMKFSNADVKLSFSRPIMGSTVRARTQLKAFAIDLLAKGVLPLTSDFYVYAKGGVAYVNLEADSKATVTLPSGRTATIKDDDSENKFRPELAVGVGYNITDNVMIDVSVSRIFGKSKLFSSDYIPDLDTAMVGLTYRFS